MAWVELGVSRLHYTLAAGDITPKAGAGRYAIDTSPAEWHGIVEESLRCRPCRLAPATSDTARRDEARESMAFAIDAAR